MPSGSAPTPPEGTALSKPLELGALGIGSSSSSSNGSDGAGGNGSVLASLAPLSRVLHTPEGGVHAFLSEPGTGGLADSQRTRISGSDSAGSGGGGLYVTVEVHVCVLARSLGSSCRVVRAMRASRA